MALPHPVRSPTVVVTSAIVCDMMVTCRVSLMIPGFTRDVDTMPSFSTRMTDGLDSRFGDL